MATLLRPIGPGDHREILAVAARAFWHDPLFDFFTRDLLHEYELLPKVFRLYFKDLRPGLSETWVGDYDGRPRGIAGWLAPGSYPRPPLREAARTVRAATVIARVRHRARAARLLLEVERRHPSEPHWYLAILATDPAIQGRGMGTALLAPVLERCDRDGTMAYTETQKEVNVSWYGRAGFVVTDEVRLPNTPPVWCLRREPRL
jgi:GNAT superfamily N-acetyltransferase